MSAPLHDLNYVLKKLHWMRDPHVWPNGLRYLWTDAFGLVLLVSVYDDLHEQHLDEADKLVREVTEVLGRLRGIRSGEASGRPILHYLAMWLFALGRLSEHHKTLLASSRSSTGCACAAMDMPVISVTCGVS